MFSFALLRLQERLKDQIEVAALAVRCIAALNPFNDILHARLKKMALVYPSVKVESPMALEITSEKLGASQRMGYHLLKGHIGRAPLKIVLQALVRSITHSTYRQEFPLQLAIAIEEAAC